MFNLKNKEIDTKIEFITESLLELQNKADTHEKMINVLQQKVSAFYSDKIEKKIT